MNRDGLIVLALSLGIGLVAFAWIQFSKVEDAVAPENENLVRLHCGPDENNVLKCNRME